MKNLIPFVFLFIAIAFMGCSSSKGTSELKPTEGHLDGTWTLSNIAVDLPAGFQVTDVFDEAPYEDFKNSTWDLVRNGKGSFTLSNGTKEEIYWSVYGKGDAAQFQFKKLKGMKPRNVDEGYRLALDSITSNSFIATSTLDAGGGQTGNITYTFTK